KICSALPCGDDNTAIFTSNGKNCADSGQLTQQLMNFKTLGIGIAVMVAITAAWVAKDIYVASQTPKGFCIDPRDESLVSLGRALYTGHCAACHGSKLQGQPNWRERREDGRLPAPPHDETGHTWHHPDAVLFDITRNGLVEGRT